MSVVQLSVHEQREKASRRRNQRNEEIFGFVRQLLPEPSKLQAYCSGVCRGTM